MKYTCMLILWGIFLIISSPVFADEKVEFQIIVHVSNPLSKLSQEEISNMFLKKMTRWQGTNQLVYPVDTIEDAPIREKFSKEIHKRKVSSIKAYWQRQIFSGSELPPPEKETQEEIMEYVSQKKGAIGYISEEAEIHGYDIKVIEIVEE